MNTTAVHFAMVLARDAYAIQGEKMPRKRVNRNGLRQAVLQRMDREDIEGDIVFCWVTLEIDWSGEEPQVTARLAEA